MICQRNARVTNSRRRYGNTPTNQAYFGLKNKWRYSTMQTFNDFPRSVLFSLIFSLSDHASFNISLAPLTPAQFIFARAKIQYNISECLVQSILTITHLHPTLIEYKLCPNDCFQSDAKHNDCILLFHLAALTWGITRSRNGFSVQCSLLLWAFVGFRTEKTQTNDLNVARNNKISWICECDPFNIRKKNNSYAQMKNSSHHQIHTPNVAIEEHSKMAGPSPSLSTACM